MNKMQQDLWVWIIVENPGGQEQYVGLYDEQASVSYIPTFHSKEDAQDCMVHLPLKRGRKYEVQAIIFEELSNDARKNDFLVFFVSADGTILERIQP